ncbi:hypothetical protein HYS00_00515 [Candidatus Microgenomates bacterium]|nr:hypothetical protein [Candidatus Microgenomates bacterium]
MAGNNFTPFQIAIKKNEPQAPQSAKKSAESEPQPIRSQEIKVEPQKEKQLSPEVAQYVKHHEETVKIPAVLKEIGVVADAKDQPIEDVVEGPVLPMTDQQIADGLKKPANMSIRWLSLFLLYLLQQAHYTIKTVHGQVKRIVKP